jgi:MFS family permease
MRSRLIAIGAVSAAAALVAMRMTDKVWQLAVLSVAAGFAMGFGQPLSMTLIVRRVTTSARSTGLAVRFTGNRIGQVAVPAAAGIVQAEPALVQSPGCSVHC